MKRLLVILLLASLLICRAELPVGLSLTINLKGAQNDVLTITPDQKAEIEFIFENTNVHPVRFQIYDYHPYHKTLPCPLECSICVLDFAYAPVARADQKKAWSSQYIVWSTTFPPVERNFHVLEPGEKLIYPVALKGFNPMANPPEKWPYFRTLRRAPSNVQNSLGNGFSEVWEEGVRPGHYAFQIRFDNVESRPFALIVKEK